MDTGNPDKKELSNTESGGNKDMVTMVSEPVQASTSEMVPFHVDTGMIPQASLEEQASAELKHLGLDVFNQNEFEQGVISQVDKALAIEEQNRLVKILQKELKSVNEYYSAARKEFVHINKLLESFEDNASSVGEKTYSAVWRQKDNKQKQLKKLKARCRFLQTKLHAVLSDDSRTDDKEDRDNTDHIASLLFKPNEESEKELEKDRLIRLGEMTPFGTVIKTKENETTPVQKKQIQLATPETSDFDKFLSEKDLLLSAVKKKCVKKPQTLTNHLPENNISKSGFRRRSLEAEDNIYSNKKPHQTNLIDIDDIKLHSWERDNEQKQDNLKHRLNSTENGKLSEDVTSDNEKHIPHHFKPENDYDSYEDVDKCVVKKKREPPPYTDDDYVPSYKKRKKNNLGPKKAKDDGDERFYRKRLKKEQDCFDSDVEDEHFEGGLKVPGVIWNNLYKYQKTGVRWLWELHCQESGGIVGDEMGLGKTIQMIVFFAALKCSKLQSKSLPYTGLGPCIIVCPTTVMHQWVREFHKWWPPFRVAILHSSGSHTGKVSELVRTIVKSHGILVTSYNTLVLHQDTVLHYNWHYVVLDEGHKIRNPDAQVTLACKQFRTPHRIILSGSPIQNNLKELWSLFDFVFPGKLGMLPDFLEHFSIPIVQGGYANATQIQVETSYKCVCVLRDTINPYLLRRMKADVQSNINLPAKSEQVLFCRLTEEQQAVYQDYLDSRECQNILAGKYKVFAGLITLRKICNHPDLSTGGPRIFVGQSTEGDETLEYGYWRRSGKLIVVEALLRLWKKQGHRILLFTQSRMMLEILESFLIKHNYNYIKMDGTTPVSSRQPLVSRFNQDTSLDVFLLTTRVGGLGVNLTGANRIIIFDPDWNPSTDMQARERAWRIGQTKPVTIYRLLTSGTIEEKIYHRQIFKQFLTNRVLKDPKQRRFFKSNDIFELFTLNNKGDGEGTETSAIFAGMGADIKMPKKKKNRFDEIKRIKNLKTEDEYEASLDEDELARMRALARKLSKQIGEGKLRRSNESTNKEHVNNTTVGNTTNTHSGKDHTHNSSHTVNGKSFKNESISENDGNYRAFGDKKKKVKDARFEGERIPYLAKHKTMKCPANKEDPQKKSVQQDDYVLRALFKGTGIQGALKHDKIMESSQPDYALVEAEAEKVAKQAAIALKRSRTQCFSAVSGIPTWTGRHGGPSTRLRFGKKKNSQLLGQTEKLKTETSSGNTKEPKLFDGSISGSAVLASTTSNVMSSDELLHKMRERHTLSTTQQSEGDPLDLLKSEDMELMTDIRNFVALEAAINGQATTQELLEHFKTKIPNNGSAKFRAMLYQICDLEKKDGIGTWRLKFEFR